jgi:hypothetical protein
VEAVELTDPGADKRRAAAVPLVTQAINSTGEETEQTAINCTGSTMVGGEHDNLVCMGVGVFIIFLFRDLGGILVEKKFYILHM